MFTRMFNAVGLIVRIAESKASLLAFGVRRSAIALLGCFMAAVVALGGVAVLLGAGYVALEAIVGVSIALSAIGVFLLLVASIIWIIANRRGRGAVQALTEQEVRENAARDEALLLTTLGMNGDASKPNFKPAGSSMRPSQQFGAIEGLDNPKVLLAAGFALISLIGPGRLLRTARIAAALVSVVALANRTINEHGEEQGAPGAP